MFCSYGSRADEAKTDDVNKFQLINKFHINSKSVAKPARHRHVLSRIFRTTTNAHWLLFQFLSHHILTFYSAVTETLNERLLKNSTVVITTLVMVLVANRLQTEVDKRSWVRCRGDIQRLSAAEVGDDVSETV